MHCSLTLTLTLTLTPTLTPTLTLTLSRYPDLKASSMERLPVEVAITKQMREFKAVTLRGKK